MAHTLTARAASGTVGNVGAKRQLHGRQALTAGGAARSHPGCRPTSHTPPEICQLPFVFLHVVYTVKTDHVLFAGESDECYGGEAGSVALVVSPGGGVCCAHDKAAVSAMKQ